MSEKKEKLFDQFPPVSTEEWKAKVEADLKGAPFEKKLVWRTNEGFNVQPMYRAEDIADFTNLDSLPGQYPFIRGTKDSNNWLTRQEIIAETPAQANEKAIEVLGKGITSLGFHVVEPTVAEIAALLKGIDLEKVEVNFSSCVKKSVQLIESLVEYLENEGLTQKFNGSVDYNPFKKALKHGVTVADEVVSTTKKVTEVASKVPGLKVLAVDSDMLSNVGAYIYQELGFALAWGADYMTMLTDAGMDASLVASKIKFNMGVSSNYFMELAKFRAARMLWAELVKQYGVADDMCKMTVHASTSKFNQTIYDAHVNLLRSQTECMSAALAGVDSITVTPFDSPYKCPDDFSERIARNQQFLLKEESHLDKVVDPAGGSYYVETLTRAIAAEAWKLFLEVEDKGGFLAAVNDGFVQKSVTESSQKRHNDVARRKEILLGTNQYPNVNEMAAEKIVNTNCGCGCKNTAEGENAGLPVTRAASDFEALRLATEAASNRPKVFMLTIGNLAMRLARAQFSTNFFGCAGYEIIDNLGFKSVEEGVDAALKAHADVVVLCSSDDEYAELAPAAYKYLNGRAEFVVAGAPACTDDLKAVGIENFVNVRSNVLETLKEFNARLLK